MVAVPHHLHRPPMERLAMIILEGRRPFAGIVAAPVLARLDTTAHQNARTRAAFSCPGQLTNRSRSRRDGASFSRDRDIAPRGYARESGPAAFGNGDRQPTAGPAPDHAEPARQDSSDRTGLNAVRRMTAEATDCHLVRAIDARPGTAVTSRARRARS
jgi:hypothetical protein